jgi:peptidoglycan/xylan/chitin deacetylase (PgdA/CDA1 family)
VPEHSINSGDVESPANRSIAITFDDLPLQQPIRDYSTIRENNRGILRILTKNQVPATGFVNEQLMSVQEEVDESLLEMWLKAGMDLGNHTFSHADLHKVSLSEFYEEIASGERLTRKRMNDRGTSLRYFRHPYLHTGTPAEMRYAVEDFLSSRGYTVAPVTVYSNEWIFTQVYDKAKFENDTNVMQYVGSRYVSYMEQWLACAEEDSLTLFGREIPQIQLLHASALNADYLDDPLSMMKGRHYSFVSLSCALEHEVYSQPETYIGPFGLSWLRRWARTKGKQLKAFAREPDTLMRLYFEAGLDL